MKLRKMLALVLPIVLLLLLYTGCASKGMGDFSGGSSYDKGEMLAPGEGIYGPNTENAVGAPYQKLIRKMRMEAETEDLDAILPEINGRIARLGGYVESRDVYNGGVNSYRNRYASMVIRIPVEHMDEFVQQIEGISNVVSSNESADDVTLSYIATQSRITALETEQTRLLELLEMAKNLDEVLTIESRLTNVRTELEEVTSQLRLYDNLIDYGTISLSLQEVKTFTVIEKEEETVWQRIKTGFTTNLDNMWTGLVNLFVGLVVALPYLIPLAVIVVVLVLVIRRSNRNARRKAEARRAELQKKSETEQ